MRISNLYMKVLLIVVMATLSISVDAQYNRRGNNNSDGNGTSMVEEAAKGVVNGVKGLFSKKKDKADDKDKKDKKGKKKDKKQDKDKKGNDDLISGLSMSSKTEPLADDDLEVIATGEGTTKEQATLSALRSALEQAYGTFVSSNTQILNDELVKDEIVSISTGNVKHFEYLSESEINGQNFVTLKAIVSIGHLLSYAKSKGSSAELAGATFAMNVRMTRFRDENIIKAINNLGDKAFEMLPYCFDFIMKGNLEPKQNRNGNYDVEFDVLLSFNSNAQYLQEIEEQKITLIRQYSYQNTNEIIKTHSLRDVLPKIFSQFKIVDNLNEVSFTDTIVERTINGIKGREYLLKSRVTPHNKNKDMDYRIKNLFCQKDGRRTFLNQSYGTPSDELACIDTNEETDRIDEIWYDYVDIAYYQIYSSRPFMRIPVKFTYTLEELEKITGIDLVVL